MKNGPIALTTVGLPVEESLRRLASAGIAARINLTMPPEGAHRQAGRRVGLRGWVIRETDAGQLERLAPVRVVLVASLVYKQAELQQAPS
ncbi:MAG: hypothetical protein H5U02_01570 [Clostridia bacterium]|nr:hypothetical protein [Clostridia bacterium]